MNTNINYAWSVAFVKRLEKLGVRNVCLSPGSRNTPLTLAFAESKKIKNRVFVDERASAFFALGLAKQSGKPVAIVTTSGTATAELYPAIIEAFQTCAPLLVCTADRPAYLRNTGANQTINQENIYRNHIRAFFDLRLPKESEARFSRLIKITDKAYFTALAEGPVHLDFPFEKPLEPHSYNATLPEGFLEKFVSAPIEEPRFRELKIPKTILKKIEKSRKALILLGGNLSASTNAVIIKAAKKLEIPVIADGISSARFTGKARNVIAYGATILRAETEKFQPDLILSFGKAPTTNSVLRFYEESKAYKILVNEKGNVHDPTRTHDAFVKANESDFADFIAENIVPKEKDFLRTFVHAENLTEELVAEFLKKEKLSFEGKVARVLIDALPPKTNLFIGNSTPPRDVDFFSGKSDKKIKVYSNRGASGIDGLIASATGVAVNSKTRTFLYLGDLSFFYDLTFLYYLKKLAVPLTIILQNNNGGGIFNMLPVAERKKGFEKYFKTPLEVNFAKIIQSFEIPYFIAETETDLTKSIEKSSENAPAIIEIETDAEYSARARKKFFEEATKKIENTFS